MNSLIEPLPWDSAFFGYRIGKYTKSVFSDSDEEAFLKTRTAADLDCVYVFADPNNSNTAAVAARNGFFLADTRAVYEFDDASLLIHQLSHPSCHVLKTSDSSAVGQIIAIARSLSTVSRFHFDARLRPRAEAMYECWARNILEDQNGTCLVVCEGGIITGFIGVTMKCTDKGTVGELVLVSTAFGYTGKGIGFRIVSAACHWLKEQSAGTIIVKTQERNLAANRLYQRAGFRVRAVQHIYHAWKG